MLLKFIYDKSFLPFFVFKKWSKSIIKYAVGACCSGRKSRTLDVVPRVCGAPSVVASQPPPTGRRGAYECCHLHE